MNGIYPCPQCKVRYPVDEFDDETGLCPHCRAPKPNCIRTDRRSCVVCGKAISGHSNRKTCSTRCRVALHRQRKEEVL